MFLVCAWCLLFLLFEQLPGGIGLAALYAAAKTKNVEKLGEVHEASALNYLEGGGVLSNTFSLLYFFPFKCEMVTNGYHK